MKQSLFFPEENEAKKAEKEAVVNIINSIDEYVKEHAEELKEQAIAKGLSSEEAEQVLQETILESKGESLQRFYELVEKLAQERASQDQAQAKI